MRSSFVSRCVFGVIALLVGSSAVGCAATTDDTVRTEASELRALTAGEIIGDIAFGTDTTAVHSGTPKYRAFGFQVAAGDTVDIWVRSSGHDAMTWLLRSDFGTVATNDDADYDAD